ncbi:Na(+)/H(+) antiporter subunit C [Zhihengliuella sp.]|uniref:Na(+)/H(+) antiporter subunit C n=1 Tax=Zhihengliuella sp. TaxID=1954483 RepID=UPI002810E9A4|nr:Na(+)/H(+) antiporter subunit C [Zhihengliuella sp.]
MIPATASDAAQTGLSVTASVAAGTGDTPSINVLLLVVMGVFFAAGVYLLLERSLTRVLLGVLLTANGVNLLIVIAGGPAGLAPLYDEEIAAGDYADPLPQALILTAIVITFAITAFMLALIYRSWVIARRDEVVDDPEDLRVAEQHHFDPEEDAVIAAETTEFVPETSDPELPPTAGSRPGRAGGGRTSDPERGDGS